MSTLRASNIQALSGSEPPVIQRADGTEVGEFCRAWVNFNGTGTVAIRASFNVTSITDNGTGDYTVNFTNAMVDANYSAVVSGSVESGSGGIPVHNQNLNTTNSSGSYRFQWSEANSFATRRDSTNNYVSIFR